MWNEYHNANALTCTKYRSGIGEYTSETIEFGPGQRKCKVLEIICKISCFDKNVEEDINHFLRVVNEGNTLNAVGNILGGITILPNAMRFYQDDTLTYSLYALLMFQYSLCKYPQQYSELIEYTVLVSLLRMQKIKVEGDETVFNVRAGITAGAFIITTALHMYGMPEEASTLITVLESGAIAYSLGNFLGKIAKFWKQKYNVPACHSILQSIIALTIDDESPKFHDNVNQLRCNSDFSWFIDKVPTVIDPITYEEKKAAEEKKSAHIKKVQLKLLEWNSIISIVFDGETVKTLGQLVVWKDDIDFTIYDTKVPYSLAKILSMHFVIISDAKNNQFKCNDIIISINRDGWIETFQKIVVDHSIKQPLPSNIIFPSEDSIIAKLSTIVSFKTNSYRLRKIPHLSKPNFYGSKFKSPLTFKYVENKEIYDVIAGDIVQISSYAGVITKS